MSSHINSKNKLRKFCNSKIVCRLLTVAPCSYLVLERILIFIIGGRVFKLEVHVIEFMKTFDLVFSQMTI